MYHAILVPTDGSSAVEGAVIRAIDIARISDAVIHALFVLDIPSLHPNLINRERTKFSESAEKRSRKITAEIEVLAADEGLETRREFLEGVPYRMILEYGREQDIDLVVMGTGVQDGTTRSRLGSTTERVLALADVLVMAVPDTADCELPESDWGMYTNVVVATDGSDAAARASVHGLDIAESYGADVHVIYVINTTTYILKDAPRSIVGLLKERGQTAVETIASTARERNLPVETAILRGVPEREIMDFATGVNADLIVMGTRGQAIDRRDRLLGSTTSRIINQADIPILAVS